ncbi:hypothetical protein [Vibrio splendidus]|uniref:hypothetical protein n=1 Tax=Vibrio splendidus TaxID=29497 RepID=UPI000D34E031|nr:hypothetical protein [Vibrio splendidus]PTO66539.1 hypothetical protein CWN99_06120 [Vibrio splendidus]
MNEKSLKSRMSWFKADDLEMAAWLKNYAKRQIWIEEIAKKTPLNDIRMDESFAQNFIDNWTSKNDISSEDKHNVNLLRSAWRSYSKREKTSTFLLSPNAKKCLNFLSKRRKVSKTCVVNEMLVATVNLIKNNKNKKFEVNLFLPKLEREEHAIDSLLKELLDIEELKKEITELKEKNATLQKSLNDRDERLRTKRLGGRRRPYK